MTNVQLLLSIGIPSVLVVLAWISNNARLTRVEHRLDRFESSTDQRFQQVDQRFQQVDQRFQQVEQRFDSVIDAAHRDALEIMRAMTALHERVAVVEARQTS